MADLKPHWMSEPEYAREMQALDDALRQEWEEAQDAISVERARKLEEGETDAR